MVYLIGAVLLGSFRRVISGIKNGAFYAKGHKEIHPRILRYVQNLHFAETPAWYTQYGSMCLGLLAVSRLMGHGLLLSLGIALLLTMSSSAIASPFYQGFINLGTGLPFVNRNENKRSEFAWGPIRFWWPRPWWGPRRILSTFLGVGMVGGGLYLLFF